MTRGGEGYSNNQVDLDRYLVHMHKALGIKGSDAQKVDDAIRRCFTKVKMDGPSTPVIYLDNMLFRSFKEARAYATSDDKAMYVRKPTSGNKRKISNNNNGRGEGSRTRVNGRKTVKSGDGDDDDVIVKAFALGDDESIKAALEFANITPANSSFGATVHAVCSNDDNGVLKKCTPRVHFQRLKSMIDNQLVLAVHIGVHISDAGMPSPFREDGTLMFDVLEAIWKDSKLMSAEYLWSLLWALRFDGAFDPDSHVDNGAVDDDARIAGDCVGSSVANPSFGAHVYAVYSNPDIPAPPSFVGEVRWMISSRLQHAMYIGRFLHNERMACPFDAEGRLQKKTLAELWRCEKRFGAEHLWEVLWGAQDDFSRDETAAAAPPLDPRANEDACACAADIRESKSVADSDTENSNSECGQETF